MHGYWHNHKAVPGGSYPFGMTLFMDKANRTPIFCNPPFLLTEDIPLGPLTESGNSSALPCV